MNLLDAFNVTSRHAHRNSFLISSTGTTNKPEGIGIMLLGVPYFAAILKSSPGLLVTAFAITAGYAGAREVYKRLKEGRALNRFWSAVSKVDMPLFVGGNAVMTVAYLKDIFAEQSASNMGDPIMALVAGAAVYTALPRLPRDPVPVLPPPDRAPE